MLWVIPPLLCSVLIAQSHVYRRAQAAEAARELACDQGVRATGGGQSCWWWSQGCSIGCERCATELIGPEGAAGGNPPHTDKIGFRKRFCNASYNSAGAPVPMINSTLP